MTLDELEKRANAVALASEHFDKLTVALAVDVLAMLPLCRDALRLYERAEKCVDRPWMGCAMDHSDIESALSDGVDAMRAAMTTEGK